MKRLITAISLLTIAGILCGIGFLSMKKQVDTLTQLFHEGAQAAQAEDEERLHTCTKELQKAWEKSHVVFSMLIQQFEKIHKRKEECLILISHQERIISLADEFIVVGDGELRHRGTPEEILPQILADTLSGCPVLTKEGAAV